MEALDLMRPERVREKAASKALKLLRLLKLTQRPGILIGRGPEAKELGRGGTTLLRCCAFSLSMIFVKSDPAVLSASAVC